MTANSGTLVPIGQAAVGREGYHRQRQTHGSPAICLHTPHGTTGLVDCRRTGEGGWENREERAAADSPGAAENGCTQPATVS